MRWTMLALLIVTICTSPALAQLPSHRAAYQPRAVASNYRTTTTRVTHVEAKLADHGFPTEGYVSGGYGDGSDGCPCGHPPRWGRNCCPGIFPDVLDNIFDPLICLIPTRAHCCPYPKINTRVCPETNYVGCTSCRQPLLNRIFPCNKRGCQDSCGSCATSESSCGCTAKAGGYDTEVITPPTPMPESPFKDDPADMPMQRGAKKTTTTRMPPKTAANSPGWYKTVRPQPVTRAPTRLNAPGVIAVGNATPITIHEE